MNCKLARLASDTRELVGDVHPTICGSITYKPAITSNNHMSTTNPRQQTDILVDLIAKKRELLLELRALTQRQAEVVSSGDMRELMTVLSAKQTLLSQVQRIEQGLDHFRQQDPESRNWRSTQERQQCRSHAEQCQQLVTELVSMEKSCEASMIRQRDQVSQQLNMADNAANARAAYVDQQLPTSGGFDIQSEA
jgi:valyl-tRNA synthetase